MGMNSIRLESGKEYTLAEIFAGHNKIVIPDLQRDYCWGDKAWDKDKKQNTELVTGFVQNLIESYENNKEELTLGLIYGFEQPKNHIQLCDGQQRITTLFLLLGMINRKSKNNDFQKYLISDFELEHDDKEPYLQYAIRESTLYFLSDLVCEFFLKSEIGLSNLKEQDWYFAEYELDASIVSIISALALIEKILKKEEYAHLNICEFGEFIVNNLQMLYYDMGNRARGEKTFVIINTTGEPLTATENLKPILIGNIKDEKERSLRSRQWDEREGWFWEKRNDNVVADNGLNEFFRWISIINTNEANVLKKLQDTNDIQSCRNLDLDEVDNYFRAVRFLFENSGVFSNKSDWLSPNRKDNYKNTQITWFRLLPVIEYTKCFGVENERNIIRVKNFFRNLSRLDSVSKNVSSLLPEAVNLIKKLHNEEKKDGDIASLIDIDGISTSLLTEEESLKFKLYLDKSRNREVLEEKFWKAESHKILKGEIGMLIEWATVDTIFDEGLFDKYWAVFEKLFDSADLDVTRRALMTQRLKDYPRFFDGWTNQSFCWNDSDWKILMSDNKDKFKQFFDQLIDAEDIKSVQERMIESFPDNEEWSEFAKTPELLKYCQSKNIQDHGALGWVLIKGNRLSGQHANLKSYLLFLYLQKESFWRQRTWKIDFYPSERTCVFFDLKEEDIAIDIYYIGKEEYQLQVFCRGNQNEKGKVCLNNLATTFELEWNGKRYDSGAFDCEGIIELLKGIIFSLS